MVVCEIAERKRKGKEIELVNSDNEEEPLANLIRKKKAQKDGNVKVIGNFAGGNTQPDLGSNKGDCDVDVGPSTEVEVIPKSQYSHVLNIRQSAQQLVGFIKAVMKVDDKSGGLKNVQKQNAIRELGFGSFLNLDLPKNNPSFVAELVSHFDEVNKCIVIERDQKLEVEPIDVHLCYGLPFTGDSVVEGDENSIAYKQVLASWRKFLGVRVGCPKLSDLVKKLLDPNVGVCDNWKRTFLVLAVNTMIKSTANTQPKIDFLFSCVDLSRVSQLNWCKYTFESLVSSTSYWKGQPGRFFCGPLPFLMLCYFDRVKRHDDNPPRAFPIISCWGKDSIASRMEFDMLHGFGKGALLSRIACPNVEAFAKQNEEVLNVAGCSVTHQVHDQGSSFRLPNDVQGVVLMCQSITATITDSFIKLHALIEHSKSLVAGNVLQDHMSANIVNAWDRVSQTQLPHRESVQNNLSHEPSILSQDSELFSSDWFLAMVDSEIERVLAESKPVNDSMVEPLIPTPNVHGKEVGSSKGFGDVSAGANNSSRVLVDNMQTSPHTPMENVVFKADGETSRPRVNAPAEENENARPRRNRTLPSRFKSPFLLQYSHLFKKGRDEDVGNLLLDYTLREDTPEGALVWDGKSVEITKPHWQSMTWSKDIFPNIIDVWAHILTERNKSRDQETPSRFPKKKAPPNTWSV